MDVFHKALAENPLATRADCVRLLLDLCRPLKPFYSAGKGLLHLGNTGAHYGEKTARMEGWARVLWGLAPLFAADNEQLPPDQQQEIEEWAVWYRTGLKNGTDPQHEDYWGELTDFDQKIVEGAAVAFALSLAPRVLWEPLDTEAKDHILAWLGEINRHQLHPNNWRFFRILTNMAFARLGAEPDPARLQQDFELIESCYCGDGWYFDGHDGQLDYYIPFAMHFYSLLWATLSVTETTERREELKQRSACFAKDFIHWFANDGAEVPFGRSLTYRFAHSAFFSALALADVEGLPWGEVRHVVLQNLRHWMQLPITDPAGLLTIGYAYPNLFMSEFYNAHGSPYWSFKAFLFLALPQEHPFWTEAEKAPEHPSLCVQKAPRMLLTHSGDHVCLYPVGQHAPEKGACSAKYEKFVYSNRFGFSVPHGQDLSGGAFDGALTASPAGMNFYRTRYGLEAYALFPAYNWSQYTLLPGTSVQSWIVPCGSDWHVRIHAVTTTSAIDLADGGFALPVEKPFQAQKGPVDGKKIPGAEEVDHSGTWALLEWGGAGIFCNYADLAAEPKMVRTAPNTNLMHNLTAVPTLLYHVQPGHYLFVHSVYGHMGADASAHVSERPVVNVSEGTVHVRSEHGTVSIDTTKQVSQSDMESF